MREAMDPFHFNLVRPSHHPTRGVLEAGSAGCCFRSGQSRAITLPYRACLVCDAKVRLPKKKELKLVINFYAAKMQMDREQHQATQIATTSRRCRLIGIYVRMKNDESAPMCCPKEIRRHFYAHIFSAARNVFGLGL